MSKSSTTVALWLALLALAPGCFLSRRAENERIRPATLARLEPGRTSAKQAVEILGAPTDVVQLGRRSAYRYDASVTKDAGLWLLVVGLLGRDTRSDRVWLFFDEAELLTHVGATLESDEAEYALPWSARE
jgi:hypothetical protein